MYYLRTPNNRKRKTDNYRVQILKPHMIFAVGRHKKLGHRTIDNCFVNVPVFPSKMQSINKSILGPDVIN
jgi:hypothetical protein